MRKTRGWSCGGAGGYATILGGYQSLKGRVGFGVLGFWGLYQARGSVYSSYVLYLLVNVEFAIRGATG